MQNAGGRRTGRPHKHLKIKELRVAEVPAIARSAVLARRGGLANQPGALLRFARARQAHEPRAPTENRK
jgi:hypothetical protein